jgi:hypothetical protein
MTGYFLPYSFILLQSIGFTASKCDFIMHDYIPFSVVLLKVHSRVKGIYKVNSLPTVFGLPFSGNQLRKAATY